MNHRIEESLKNVLAENLTAINDLNVTALRHWLDGQKREAQLWADRERLVDNVTALVQAAEESDSSPDLSKQGQINLAELLSIDSASPRHYVIAARSGKILASSHDQYLGLNLNAKGMEFLYTVFERGGFISHPIWEGELITGAQVQKNFPRILCAAPILETNGEAIAALVFLIDPEEGFTKVLTVGAPGESGHTYAFDRNGVLLSDSRFEQELKQIGILPDTPEAQSILNVQIRDPGGDLTRGHSPELPVSGRPLTEMASAAVEGVEGMNLQGYRDFRGVTVLGAWRWIPEHDLGIATEVSLEEALHVIRPLTLAYRFLFWTLMVMVVMVLIANLMIYRLRRQIRGFQKIGSYTLERKIGEGGMGEVYLARHRLLRRPTAIKLVRSDKLSAEEMVRFEREVRVTSELKHPNTIAIYDYGRTLEGIFYYVMEYLDGITLAKFIEMEGGIEPGRAAHILRQICGSLEEAHAIGLVHRDIKPMNVMLTRLGREPDFVKVLDFGLVKDLVSDDDLSVTSTHELRGTPLYIAPERLKDPRRADPRTDIYSAGVVAYNLLTGKDLFEGSSALELSHHVLASPRPRISDDCPQPIPPQFEQLITACLSKDPDERPGSMREVIERLEAIQNVCPWDREKAVEWWDKFEAKSEMEAAAKEGIAVNAAGEQRPSIDPVDKLRTGESA